MSGSQQDALIAGFATAASYDVSPFWFDATDTAMQEEQSIGTGLSSPIIYTTANGNGSTDPTPLVDSGPSGTQAAKVSDSTTQLSAAINVVTELSF
jgi:hypothetical protein